VGGAAARAVFVSGSGARGPVENDPHAGEAAWEGPGDGQGRPGDIPGAGEGAAVEDLRGLAASKAGLAGLLLRERFHHVAIEDIESKSTPTDLVSEADRSSQRFIRESLAIRRPRDGFLGEEGGDDDPGESGLRWVVDPLDGTVNFLFGIPHWCVSIAVEDDRGTLAGAIYDPIRDELFTAARGAAATLRSPIEDSMHGPPPPANRPHEYEEITLRGPEPRDLSTAMLATGLAYDARVRAAQARVLARVIPQVRDIRRFGSAALDLAWTAAGRYDAYFERTVKPWDIAAGVLICEAVGLRVLELPEHEDLPWGILVAPPELCEPLLELVGGPG
jgi:myo-inositol-1(or 4)-monophosphatase